MNINNLKVGNVYNKYKDICEALNDKIMTGDKKKYQLKEWDRYFLYSLYGNTYKILNIYEKPFPENENPLKLIDTYQNLIINKALKSESGNKITLSHSDFFNELMILNRSYVFDMYRQLVNTDEYEKIATLSSIESAYLIPEDIVNNNIIKALKGLRNKSLGQYTKSYELNNHYDVMINSSAFLTNDDILDKNYIINYEEDRNKIMGIYSIRNTITNKAYIGSSIDIDGRLKHHMETLEENTHHNYKLQEEYNKHGINIFRFELIEIVKHVSSLPMREYKWIRINGGLYSNSIYNISDPRKENELAEKRRKYSYK